MSTELTREQACDAYRKNCGGITVIERSAFEAGWSARDTEVERLRAAIKQVIADNTYPGGEATFGFHKAIQQLQAALNPTEPSDA